MNIIGCILFTYSFWIKIASNLFFKVFIYKKNGFLKSRYTNTSIILMISFNLLKASYYFYFYIKKTSFTRRLVMNVIIFKNPDI